VPARLASQPQGSRKVSVKLLVADMQLLIIAINKSSASKLKKRRARLLLESLQGVIRAFCLANTSKDDYVHEEFEIGGRGK
jgi:hypothetical protein